MDYKINKKEIDNYNFNSGILKIYLMLCSGEKVELDTVFGKVILTNSEKQALLQEFINSKFMKLCSEIEKNLLKTNLRKD